MSKFTKNLLIISGINLAILLLGLVFVEILILWLLIMVVEFFIALILLIASETRAAGQAMLLSSLLGLLIGFSICSNMSFGLH